MASTLTVQDSINWAQAFAGYMPFTIGAANEPAISSANAVIQTILAPPFKWNWNRKSAGPEKGLQLRKQDLVVSLADFGYLEKASIYVPNQGPIELEVKPILGDSAQPARPNSIAPQTDDGAGNITFRFLPSPDQPYDFTLIYQGKPPKIGAVTDTWGPIPDYLSFVYNWGFLALMLDYSESTRAARARQLFVASLLSVAEGLSETEKNLFISSWLGTVQEIQSAQYLTQLGAHARGI